MDDTLSPEYICPNCGGEIQYFSSLDSPYDGVSGYLCLSCTDEWCERKPEIIDRRQIVIDAAYLAFPEEGTKVFNYLAVEPVTDRVYGAIVIAGNSRFNELQPFGRSKAIWAELEKMPLEYINVGIIVSLTLEEGFMTGLVQIVQ